MEDQNERPEETPANERPSNRPEDFETAKELLEENKFLRTDSYARQVLESEGLTAKGVVDIGDFLAARVAVLEEDAKKMAAARTKNPRAYEAAMVVHSVRPDLENRIDN